ncbi:hypothetical protein LNKW23_09910 [Paralimibaculum aggregatum]|uniref:Uncharacterized protein n=1 Tax=Paralimibaculum aggregatum TaxID=3036245 RepID=A0ABQ6LKL9_9RHOB|nr:hypothetical protein [Limibaculum sp. NKW23]GMG81778.1 hypothetical protein LNKW23_09910 [Limibaculum sp. NKW23]
MSATRLTLFRVCILLAALYGVFAAPANAQIVLDGRYDGIGPAAGSEIRIAPDPGGFTGSFRPAGGQPQPFEADRRGDQAETVVKLDGRVHLLQMTPLPYGAEVAFIPFADDGTLVLEGASLFTYLREGISLPEPPEGYREAPRDVMSQFAANSFLVSYEFWRPTGVRNGYLSLPSRARTMIRLFPAVQLDIIWKLCLAPKADDALAVALKGQGVTCDAVVTGLAEIQSAGRFDAYKAEVAKQKSSLIDSVRCGEGYVMTRAACTAAGKAVAEAAISLETAATVLRRHR